MGLRRSGRALVALASRYEALAVAGGAECVDACATALAPLAARVSVYADRIDNLWRRTEARATEHATFAWRRVEYGARNSLITLMRHVSDFGRGVRTQALEAWRGSLADGLPGAEKLSVPRSAVMASILINLFGLALPLTVLEVYDSVIPHGGGGQLLILAIGFAVVLAIESVLRVSRAYVTGLSAAQFEAAAVCEGLRRFVSAPHELTAQDPATRRLSRLTAVSRLAEFYGGPMRWAMIDLPFVVLYIGAMAIIGGPIVLAPLVVLAAFFALSATTSEKLTSAIRDRQDQDAKVYDFITECLSGIVSLKGAAMEPFMARRLERLLGQSRAIIEKTILTAGQQENLANLLGNVTFIAMATVGGILAIFGDMSVGALAACSLLAGRIVQPVLRAASVWRAVHGLRLARAEAQAVFCLPESTAPAVKKTACPLKEMTLRAADGTVLARCGPAGLIAISGSDSAARSELLLALAGRGACVLAGLEIDGASASAFRARHKRAILLTTPKMDALSGTILENLTLFGRGATAGDVIWASELIGLRRDIDRLASGFETRIGESNSSALPSGLMHRITIARAIALRPQILVLDEPQALLDLRADRELLAGLRRLKSECVIILGSSRPSYLTGADHAIVLENGAFRTATRESGAASVKGVA